MLKVGNLKRQILHTISTWLQTYFSNASTRMTKHRDWWLATDHRNWMITLQIVGMAFLIAMNSFCTIFLAWVGNGTGFQFIFVIYSSGTIAAQICLIVLVANKTHGFTRLTRFILLFGALCTSGLISLSAFDIGIIQSLKA